MKYVFTNIYFIGALNQLIYRIYDHLHAMNIFNKNYHFLCLLSVMYISINMQYIYNERTV